jgi:uncharacterized membrane protein YdbT with pleckstrin-like domain
MSLNDCQVCGIIGGERVIMGSYVRKSLSRGEQILAETSYHWVIFLGSIVMSVVIVLLLVLALASGIEVLIEAIDFLDVFLVILLAGSFIRNLIIFKTTEFAVTSGRIIIKKGFITLDAVEIELSKIEEINIKQSVFGRIFGYGSLQVRGTGTGKIWYNLIAKPFAFQKAIDEALRSSRA